MNLYRIIRLAPKRGAVGGELYMFQPGEGPDALPFEIKKVLYIRGVKPGDIRGNHAHHATEEALICLRGGCTVEIDDGLGNRAEVRLENPSQALLLYPRVWRVVRDFEPDTEILIVAGCPYEECDYIRDRKRFEELVEKWSGNLGGSSRTNSCKDNAL